MSESEYAKMVLARRLAARMMGAGEDEQIYTFHRAEGFYPFALANDETARLHAQCNPGTTKVVNEMTGTVVWPDA